MDDAETKLSNARQGADAGEIVVTPSGKPAAARTCRPNRRRSTLLGLFQGQMHIAEDFDAILPGFEPYV
jgi:hypothetical protein